MRHVIPRSFEDLAEGESSSMHCYSRDLEMLNLEQLGKHAANSDLPEGWYSNNQRKQNHTPGPPKEANIANTILRAESGLSGGSTESAFEFGVVPMQSGNSGLLFALRRVSSDDVLVPERLGDVTGPRPVSEEESSSSAARTFVSEVEGGLLLEDATSPDRRSSSNCFLEKPLRLIKKTRDGVGSPLGIKLKQIWMSQSHRTRMEDNSSEAE